MNPFFIQVLARFDALRYEVGCRLRGKVFSKKLSEDDAAIVAQIKDKGYCIIPEFFSRDECHSMTVEIDSLMQSYPQAVWVDRFNSDNRIFGAELASSSISSFFESGRLCSLASAVLGWEQGNLQTLVGRIRAVAGNIGSGQGWHRDSNNFQFKAIVYLTDVTEVNGPFQFLKNSHTFSSRIRDSIRLRKNPLLSRFSDLEVAVLVADDPGRLVTVTAPAGTLALVMVNNIHRGMPIQEGQRYALFNYYFPSFMVNETMRNHFKPRLTSEMLK